MLMGWQSEKKKPEDCITEAITYYQGKYGKTPNYCEVHQSLCNLSYPGIEIAPVQHVYTANLFYIGVKD